MGMFAVGFKMGLPREPVTESDRMKLLISGKLLACKIV